MRHHDSLLKTAAAIFLTAGMLFLSGCGGKDNGIEIVDLSGYENGGMLTDRMLDSMAQEIRVIELSAGEDLTVPVYPERVKFTATAYTCLTTKDRGNGRCSLSTATEG